MKKLILACLMLASLPVLSFAQSTVVTPQGTTSPHTSRPSPEMMAERRSTMLKQQLGLSDDQYKSVYQCELNSMRREQEMLASGNRPAPEQMQQMRMAQVEEIKKFLTPDQAAKFEKMMPPARPRPSVVPVGTDPAAAPAAH